MKMSDAPLPVLDLTTHLHCWHDTGKVHGPYEGFLFSQHVVICCFCGFQKRRVTLPSLSHGRFLPAVESP